MKWLWSSRKNSASTSSMLSRISIQPILHCSFRCWCQMVSFKRLSSQRLSNFWPTRCACKSLTENTTPFWSNQPVSMFFMINFNLRNKDIKFVKCQLRAFEQSYFRSIRTFNTKAINFCYSGDPLWDAAVQNARSQIQLQVFSAEMIEGKLFFAYLLCCHLLSYTVHTYICTKMQKILKLIFIDNDKRLFYGVDFKT